jgi:hypothetical protein
MITEAEVNGIAGEGEATDDVFRLAERAGGLNDEPPSEA